MDDIYRRMLRGLVDRVGGFDAATAVVEAASGPFSKGTLSKMCSGQAALTFEVVGALENATGRYPLTQRWFERIGDGGAQEGDLHQLLAALARDSGAAVSELATGVAPDGEDAERLSPAERARINIAARALRADCERLIAATEAPSGAAPEPGAVYVPLRAQPVR